MTNYFGVVSNRDYIKLDGERRPFWEFLDRQPDGWLLSLAYKEPALLPESRNFLIDCGAWSYRNEDRPSINAVRALDQYLTYAPPGAMLMAPDHMLIEGADLEHRRRWNRRQAERFLAICPSTHKPMAAIHGMTLRERVKNARALADMGYKYLAIGGVAARAARRSLVGEWVTQIRQTVPDAYLHVLGLTSPSYMRMWSQLGIQSADGSSHFKQAFTAGAFFTLENGAMRKHAAARTGEAVSAPSCDCKACATLRENGIETRMYGSNENNMGRAAHNLNILMRAHQCDASTLSLV